MIVSVQHGKRLLHQSNATLLAINNIKKKAIIRWERGDPETVPLSTVFPLDHTSRSMRSRGGNSTKQKSLEQLVDSGFLKEYHDAKAGDDSEDDTSSSSSSSSLMSSKDKEDSKKCITLPATKRKYSKNDIINISDDSSSNGEVKNSDGNSSSSSVEIVLPAIGSKISKNDSIRINNNISSVKDEDDGENIDSSDDDVPLSSSNNARRSKTSINDKNDSKIGSIKIVLPALPATGSKISKNTSIHDSISSSEDENSQEDKDNSSNDDAPLSSMIRSNTAKSKIKEKILIESSESDNEPILSLKICQRRKSCDDDDNSMSENMLVSWKDNNSVSDFSSSENEKSHEDEDNRSNNDVPLLSMIRNNTAKNKIKEKILIESSESDNELIPSLKICKKRKICDDDDDDSMSENILASWNDSNSVSELKSVESPGAENRLKHAVRRDNRPAWMTRKDLSSDEVKKPEASSWTSNEHLKKVSVNLLFFLNLISSFMLVFSSMGNSRSRGSMQ